MTARTVDQLDEDVQAIVSCLNRLEQGQERQELHAKHQTEILFGLRNLFVGHSERLTEQERKNEAHERTLAEQGTKLDQILGLLQDKP